MGFYDRYVLPRFLDLACGMKAVGKQREKVVPGAEGRVLEIGVGSGLNLPYYDKSKISELIGLDPASEMVDIARKRARDFGLPLSFVELEAEQIAMDDDSVDCVVMTFTLCTIPGTRKALEEMRRVLKPGGRLLFCEHGKAPDAGVYKWQNRLNRPWGKIAGGCNLNRDIPALLGEGGFLPEVMDTGYLPKTPRFLGFNYWGSARAA